MAPLRAVAGAFLVVAAAAVRRASSPALHPTGALAAAASASGGDGLTPPLAAAAAAAWAGPHGGARLATAAPRPAAGAGDEEHGHVARHLGGILGLARGGAAARGPEELVVEAAEALDRITSFSDGPGGDDEYLLTAAGAELHAVEAAKAALESRVGERDRDEARSAKRSELAARLAQKLARGVQGSAKFALSVTASTFSRLLQRHPAGDEEGFVRVADAVGCSSGKAQAQGAFLDLRGGALEGAAQLDVAQSLVPSGTRPRAKLSLLGLVAAMNHEAVFRKVQEALRRDDGMAPYLTIREYLAARGASGAAGLVNRTLLGTVAGAALRRPVSACLLAAMCASEPSVQLIAWGARLASVAVALHAPFPGMRSQALSTLDALADWELYAFVMPRLFSVWRRGWEDLSAGDAVLVWVMVWHTIMVRSGVLPPLGPFGQKGGALSTEPSAEAPPGDPLETAVAEAEAEAAMAESGATSSDSLEAEVAEAEAAMSESEVTSSDALESAVAEAEVDRSQSEVASSDALESAVAEAEADVSESMAPSSDPPEPSAGAEAAEAEAQAAD